ncbi:class I SAM-dependent DNA methyltransferase [Roseinatronobacter monicus]|uniref:site-specific DNA-methyltransferase (adenine-specific) n=1 Tax=Roseinatronobacter monicus TaxID=393481 RepID=A0A543KIM6_9RHOB|nr:DNA methyltransferase [Roseinatronobacter monicus]TQM94936.1 type II restriction/modification system DNA methylase subunit YeeA [Roseinatronobacter monicus]
MNAVEIEQAVSELAEQPFDAAEFPYAFLTAFGNKETTIKRLRTGASNKSDIGGILQTNNIHLKTCAPGDIAATLTALRDSPATTRAKAKFILATDGIDLEAEDITSGETIACRYTDFPDHFGFFLPLAGISTVKQIRESAFDIRATSRLNRLYVELIKDNPDWGSAEKRHDMNHFMARLIFCFFAEDTDIFVSDNLFTATIDQMANRDGSNTHEVIGEIFRAMNTAIPKRAEAKLPRWADTFPYVNGGLFSGSTEVPRFSKIAQRYLSHIGSLDWTQINPDIFGSMIQAVADEEERSVLGMHYTSVPNILKVLNPLFLDDLRAELEVAGDNARKLANLRARMAKIRVFDPACGSGNFLVIAYKEMRALEYEINKRRGEPQRRTDIPLTNYRGIELRDFSAEIARLALIIAEYQCDVRYRGQKEALAEFLPLDAQNWITCGNALRLDWLSICPPTGTGVKFQADDLFMSPLDQAQIDFANEGGETYICGNPPYQGSVNQTPEQKEDMARIFERYLPTYKDLDYVASWLVRSAEFAEITKASAAFVTTNSICQGEQVGMLWPILFSKGQRIFFAHTSFLWRNNAANNAGVTCIVVGLSNHEVGEVRLFDGEIVRAVQNIGPYLTPSDNTIVKKSSVQISGLPTMVSGNKATDGGNLILTRERRDEIVSRSPNIGEKIKRLEGAKEFIRGDSRWCLWLVDGDIIDALSDPEISKRIEAVRKVRLESRGKQANDAASFPHRFVYAPHVPGRSILIPSVSSERRDFLPCGYFDDRTVIVAPNLAMYGAPIWCLSLIASRLHLVWIATVCGKLKTDFRYSNTLGWNTFPVPKLTEKNRADLTAAAEGILLAREAHFPATIADLYDPEKMPANLRAAHDHNDEVLERIYIGRRFRNDTERLEKLFEMYTKMTTKVADLA